MASDEISHYHEQLWSTQGKPRDCQGLGLAQELLEPHTPWVGSSQPQKPAPVAPQQGRQEQVDTWAFHQTENAKGRSMSPCFLNDYLLIKNERNLHSCRQSDWQITGTTDECFNQINCVRPGSNSPACHDF